ncbi:MAG: hypothetical protein F6K39_35470 [Okeania sp. SIO3B3]|nr:hypothetical protein [Okeania sp. SIO3B3]
MLPDLISGVRRTESGGKKEEEEEKVVEGGSFLFALLSGRDIIPLFTNAEKKRQTYVLPDIYL